MHRRFGFHQPAWLVRRAERRQAGQRATQTTDDFDVWDDVIVHLDDQRVYGTVIAVDDGEMIVRERGKSIEHRVKPDALDPL
jgi:predicted RNA-binding protein with PUA domain